VTRAHVRACAVRCGGRGHARRRRWRNGLTGEGGREDEEARHGDSRHATDLSVLFSLRVVVSAPARWELATGDSDACLAAPRRSVRAGNIGVVSGGGHGAGVGRAARRRAQAREGKYT
jgi:hypothetical protein